ncbi:helix-turn-helix transcriptional regulator [Streptomyces anulatus]|uniref:helix-turn-helix transcriptional regulator n=1 Tax=Streptomyces anulatus TaxID=1892 RepID=UPI0036897857
MSEEHPQDGSDELLTLAQISDRFEVSRQTVHTARQRGVFPAPEPVLGSTRLRWRQSAVEEYFAANPKRPGTRTDLQDDQPDGGSPPGTT